MRICNFSHFSILIFLCTWQKDKDAIFNVLDRNLTLMFWIQLLILFKTAFEFDAGNTKKSCDMAFNTRSKSKFGQVFIWICNNCVAFAAHLSTGFGIMIWHQCLDRTHLKTQVKLSCLNMWKCKQIKTFGVPVTWLIHMIFSGKTGEKTLRYEVLYYQCYQHEYNLKGTNAKTYLSCGFVGYFYLSEKKKTFIEFLWIRRCQNECATLSHFNI